MPSPQAPAKPVTCVYKKVDGHEISADVYLPPSRPRPPVLVYIHGGALIWGTRKMLRPSALGRYLADGLAVVAIDYRFAPETTLPEIARDLEDAFRWVRTAAAERFNFDGQRVGVVGHSAGGYLSLLAGCRITPKPRAIVSLYGYGDIAGDWYARPDPFYCQEPAVSREEALASVGSGPISDTRGEGRGRFYLYCRQQGLWPKMVSGLDPATERDALREWCPAECVAADYPPTLLLHGDRDTDVPYSLSVMMAEALARAGVKHELVTIRGGEHVFDDDVGNPRVVGAFDRIDEFLIAHLKP